MQPKRELLRKDSEDPSFKKSNTARVAPTATAPYTEMAEPKRENFRKASEDPTSQNPKTDMAAPSRANDRKDRDEPSLA